MAGQLVNQFVTAPESTSTLVADTQTASVFLSVSENDLTDREDLVVKVLDPLIELEESNKNKNGPDEEIRDLIVLLGEKYETDVELALEIARCESHLRHYGSNGKVIRGRVNPKDVGVFQINESFHAQASKKLGFDIYTPEGNVAYGLWLLKNSGSRPWKASQNCWQSKELAAAR